MDNIFEPLTKELFVQILNSLEQQQAKNVNQTTLAMVNKNQKQIHRCFAEIRKKKFIIK